MLTLLEVNPDSVRAGWVPLLIVIGVAVIIALLGWSMMHEIKKVKVPTRAEVAEREAAGDPVSPIGAPVAPKDQKPVQSSLILKDK